ncbi:MAG: hydroxymethylbilane synthase [Caldilineaceae bacterium]|nr:hydroxymethylbilane synthase [Caldilineaceae bacterium]
MQAEAPIDTKVPAQTPAQKPHLLGTRKSQLALWQTRHVIQLLSAAWPTRQFAEQHFVTQGDRVIDTPLPQIGGKGLFTLELENALHNQEIDMAVHSLKDLPTESPAGLAIGAIPTREDALDALVCRAGHTLRTLPQGATVGTSSRRRAAQLLYTRPDLQIIDIRGNVDTRLRKALDADGPYDGIVLAYAGLKRLERADVISELLPLEVMMPAPGQGALGVQCRDDADSMTLLQPLRDAETTAAVTAERAFLAGLGSGCSLPVAAFGQVSNGVLILHGRVTAPDGAHQIDVFDRSAPAEGAALGKKLAMQALAQGAARYL